jgi:uncharacterized membrane protein
LSCPPYIYNNYSRAYLAYYKACLVKVVCVVVLDAILSFNAGYKAETALYNLRIFVEGLLVVILAIKDYFKLLLTQNKRTSLV